MRVFHTRPRKIAAAVIFLLILAPFVWVAANPEPDAVLSDGGRYYGSMVDGMLHGEGRLKWRNGAVYEGEFKQGLFHGQGHHQRADGSQYQGQYRQGLPHGKGRIEHRSYSYEGRITDNRIHGQGRMEFSDGRVYEGFFRDHEPVRDVVYTDSAGTRYEGGMDEWRFHGKGVLTDPAGNVYEGRFENGVLTGKGSYEGHDGERYAGEFEAMRFHGKGRLELPDGDVYEGGFFYGNYHGEGTLTLAEPDEYGRHQLSGDWVYGRFQDDRREPTDITRSNVERALYAQQSLLDEALGAIKPSDPDAVNLYLIVVAGDGSEEVFRREAEFITEQFDRDFATRGRSLKLVNSRTTLDKYPMATVTSLEQALAGVASRMNPEQDILFIYLTSHGSRDHQLKIAQNGMQLPGLSAQRLSELLREQPFLWKVISVSACYSGGFVDHLKDGRTLIMTAARDDRASFGCHDTAEMTYFGQAYFRDALPVAASFQDAFDKAVELVTAREKEEEISPHSRPQMHDAPAVREHLQQWWQQARTNAER